MGKDMIRIGSCLACVYRVMDARGKFGEQTEKLSAYGKDMTRKQEKVLECCGHLM